MVIQRGIIAAFPADDLEGVCAGVFRLALAGTGRLAPKGDYPVRLALVLMFGRWHRLSFAAGWTACGDGLHAGLCCQIPQTAGWMPAGSLQPVGCASLPPGKSKFPVMDRSNTSLPPP